MSDFIKFKTNSLCWGRHYSGTINFHGVVTSKGNF